MNRIEIFSLLILGHLSWNDSTERKELSIMKWFSGKKTDLMKAKNKFSVYKNLLIHFELFFFCFQLAIYLSGKTVFSFFCTKTMAIVYYVITHMVADERTWFHFARVHLRTSKHWIVYIIKHCQLVKILYTLNTIRILCLFSFVSLSPFRIIFSMKSNV